MCERKTTRRVSATTGQRGKGGTDGDGDRQEEIPPADRQDGMTVFWGRRVEVVVVVVVWGGVILSS